MDNKILIRTILAAVFALSVTAALAYGQEEEDGDKAFTGNIRMRYDYFFANGDKGRFRQDNWRNDDASWGVDFLKLRNTKPTKNGYDWEIQGKALYSYDYDIKFLLKKEDSHYFKFDFSSLRRYYDGSNEYWDPTMYSASKNLAEMPDSDLFLDRRNYNVEFGTVPQDGAQFITGWHRLVTDGKKTHLYGGRATEAGLPDFYGIPSITSQRGITDTIYGELAQTFAEKYNFRIRQEFEQYHDDQLTVFPRSDSGALTDQRYNDNPGYTNWRTLLMLDSFIDEENYVTANYMYNYLNNDSTRNASEMVLGSSRAPFTDNQAGASQRTNSAAFGHQKLNLLPNLDMTSALDFEDSTNTSKSSGLLGGTSESFSSKKNLRRIGNSVRLVFRGIERTTLSFDARAEKKFFKWKEDDDGAGWRADSDHTNHDYTIKAVRRHNKSLKSTLKFRLKDHKRRYTNLFDSDPGSYPGFMGNYRVKGSDVTAKTDWKISSTTNTTLMYQFIQESIDTSVGTKTQNLEIHRGSGSISINPSPNLFMVGSFMLENYRLDTPAQGSAASTISNNSQTFDYVGNSYSILLDGTYVFSEKISCTFGFQHTESLGEGDGNNTNDSRYDKLKFMLNWKLSENRTVSAGYQFVDFDNRNGGDFDDYDAHGVFLTYQFNF